MTGTADRFDEVRRAWIAGHQGWSTIQRRRAELLGRKVRAAQRAVAAAVPDPHDDTVIAPLWLRSSKSPASQAESLFVLVTMVAVPIGWIGGVLLNRIVTQLIPRTLRAYPIVALLWSGGVLGLCVAACYDPGPTAGQLVLAPWFCAQVAATPFIAGVYGIAEGWLAVPGSDDWWPLIAPKPAMTAEDADLILGRCDKTGPGLLDVQRRIESGERSRPW